MNLIEQLGLEKCHAILKRATWGSHYRQDTDEIICCNNEDHFYFRELKNRGVEFIRLADIRTAIADHDRTDYVSDIRNHISPTTVVIEK